MLRGQRAPWHRLGAEVALSPLGCGDEQESRDLFTGKRLREAQKKQK